MQYTANYKFKKPEYNEFGDINDINEAMDTIDQVLKEVSDGAGGGVELIAKDTDIPIAKRKEGVLYLKIINGAGKVRVELQDWEGNAYYPQATDEGVLLEDGTNLKSWMESTRTTLDGKAEKDNPPAEISLQAAGWEGTEEPYTITVPLEKATATNRIEVMLSATATKDQAIAFACAAILKGTQAAGSMTLYAYGDKPEIDIPITIIIGGD